MSIEANTTGMSEIDDICIEISNTNIRPGVNEVQYKCMLKHQRKQQNKELEEHSVSILKDMGIMEVAHCGHSQKLPGRCSYVKASTLITLHRTSERLLKRKEEDRHSNK